MTEECIILTFLLFVLDFLLQLYKLLLFLFLVLHYDFALCAFNFSLYSLHAPRYTLALLYAKRCTLHAIHLLVPISKEEPWKQSPGKPEQPLSHRNNSL